MVILNQSMYLKSPSTNSGVSNSRNRLCSIAVIAFPQTPQVSSVELRRQLAMEDSPQPLRGWW